MGSNHCHRPLNGGRLTLCGDHLTNLHRLALRNPLKSVQKPWLLNALGQGRKSDRHSGSRHRKLDQHGIGQRLSGPVSVGCWPNLAGRNGLHLDMGHRPLADSFHLLKRRSAVVLEQVAVGSVITTDDLGDVHTALKNRDVLCHGGKHRGVARPHEVSRVDEGVTGWAEVIPRVTIAIHRAAGSTVWRKWCPADVITTLTPGHPGGSPFVAGNPDPAVAREIHPAAIVVSGPAKWLVRLPSPAHGRPHPAAIHIWAPARRCDAGPPAVAITAHLHPAPVGG